MFALNSTAKMSSGSWVSLSRPSHSRMEDHKKINIKKFNMKDLRKAEQYFIFIV